MKTINIAFHQFWYDFNNQDNIFTYILSHKYNLKICDINHADYIFTGNKDIIIANKVNIFFSGEPTWDKGNCEYGIVQYNVYDKDNYIRLPLYLYYAYDCMKKKEIIDLKYFSNKKNFSINDLKQKTKFCNFICGGPIGGAGQYRDVFVKKLSKYKNIDCPGTRFNNMTRLPGDSSDGLNASYIKRNFIKDYKFTIGFESNSTRDGYDGYTTEKFIEPLICNTMLIYWGNKLINNEFNNLSFINFWDYNNEDDVIAKIIEIDNNDQLYLDIANQQYTYDNKYFNINYLISLFDKIIN